MENISVICGRYLCGLKIIYGPVWVFCEWANKIKARKFVPQHLTPQVTCEQFLLGHTCEFEILVVVMNSALLQLLHVQHLPTFST